MYKVHLIVSKFMIQKLIPFATTWLCENAFSAMCVNRLEVEADLRLCLSKVTPRGPWPPSPPFRRACAQVALDGYLT